MLSIQNFWWEKQFFFPTACSLIGCFKVTWHVPMKLFPSKISQPVTLQNSMTLEGNSALLPANVDRRAPSVQRGLMNFQLQNFQLYNRSSEDWGSRGKHWDSREKNELFLFWHHILEFPADFKLSPLSTFVVISNCFYLFIIRSQFFLDV